MTTATKSKRPADVRPSDHGSPADIAWLRKNMPNPFGEVRYGGHTRFFEKAVVSWFKKTHRPIYSPYNGHKIAFGVRTAHLLLQRILPDAIDHWGVATYGGRQCWISQPYGATDETIAKCRDLAAAIGWEFVLSEHSHWFPGETISLAWVEPNQVLMGNN